MNSPGELNQAFLSFSRNKLTAEMWPRLCSCFDELSDAQIWWRPNEASNSIGNLLLHLNGNLRQWMLQGLGGVQNSRDRDSEFHQRTTIPLSELRAALDGTLREVDALLAKLSPEDLLRRYDIQTSQGILGIDAIYHVVEHFAMHYGQILYISKLLAAHTLGFYAHLDNAPPQ